MIPSKQQAAVFAKTLEIATAGAFVMKHILFLFTKESVRRQQEDPAELTRHLNQAAKPHAVRYHFAYYDDLLHHLLPDHVAITDKVSNKRLEQFDLVYHRRWGDSPELAMACALYLKAKNVPGVDTEIHRRGAMDKLTQYWRLWGAGLPFPSSVFVPYEHVTQWVRDELERTFTLPCIMKSVIGRRGQDNYLVHSAAEALAVLKQSPDVHFIFQEFIPNDGDYRALVAGDRLRMLIHRQAAQGAHTNNTSRGGSARLVPVDTLPDQVQAACVRAAQSLHRDVAGVDVVLDRRDPSRFYFFEVNRSPQIETSSFTKEKAAMLHDYFKELLEQKQEASHG